MLEFTLHHYLRDGKIDIPLEPADKISAFRDSRPPLIHLLKHSARAHREVRATSQEHIERSLRTLAAFSKFIAGSGIEWYLTGGIGIDLVKCRSFRQHGDLDIVLSIDQAPLLADFIAYRGAAAYRRVWTTALHGDERVTVMRRCSPALDDFGNHRTLKLCFDSRDRLLPVVDIHFVALNDGMTSVLCNREICDLPIPLGGDRSFVVNGEPVRCCDLQLQLYMKSDDNPRNFRDARRIAEELTPAAAAEVAQLRIRDFGESVERMEWAATA